MAIIRVTTIASIDALNRALSMYREQSLVTVQGFASMLFNKVAHLESLESYFAEQVHRAEAALRSCEFSRSMDAPGQKRSCTFEASRLANARSKYSHYKSIMVHVKQAASEYKVNEGGYSHSLNEIASTTVPILSNFIVLLHQYYSADEEVAAATKPRFNAKKRVENALHTDVITPGAAVPSIEPEIAIKSDQTGIATQANDVQADVQSAGDPATQVDESSGALPLVIAGISIPVVAAGILLYFRQNGVDNDFANREIHRVLSDKYGAPLGVLPHDQRVRYIADYNALSKAVEADIKKQNDREIEEIKAYQHARREYDHALLAEHVYHPEQAIGIDWSQVTPTNIDPNAPVYALVKKIEECNQDGSGFYAQLYQNDFTGEYTLAFRGSDPIDYIGLVKKQIQFAYNPLKYDEYTKKLSEVIRNSRDWVTNAAQGLGNPSKQYENAKELGKIIGDIYKPNPSVLNDIKIQIVGHSLGGGLATVAGLESKCKTFTYNQAELTHTTIRRLNLLTDDHQNIIKAYHDSTEGLIIGQNMVNEHMSRAVNGSDFKFTHEMANSPDNYFSRLGTVEYINAEGSHGMNSVVEYFKDRHAEILKVDRYDGKYYMRPEKFETAFKIDRIAESPPPGPSLENLGKSFKNAGVIGIVSKK